jgi:hypothetical protein
MENFNVGEVVWAKIRGYPWWPGYIRGIEDDNKEKKFVVQFIGDNTFSNIPKKQLGKFEKEYEIHSNTKKKDLKESIKIALDMYKNKKGIDFLEKSNNLLKRKFRKENDDDNNSENSSSVNNSSSEKNNFDGKNKNNNNNNNEKINNNNVNYSNKRKKKDEKNGNEILNKISLYLHKIVVEIYKDKLNLDVVKVCLIKVLKFLKEFKLNDPIDFLKKSGVGKCVKYIKEKINDNEIKDLSNEVYKNLEDQVLQQIFPKK